MPSFWNMLRNNVFVMVCVMLAAVIVSALAAFVFARLEFRGKSLTFNILMLGILFPMSIAILPVYLLLRQLHLLNPAGVILLVLGDRSGLTPKCTMGETRDSTDLKLPGVQEDLVLPRQ